MKNGKYGSLTINIGEKPKNKTDKRCNEYISEKDIAIRNKFLSFSNKENKMIL
jgi:hypothetical protein